MIKWEILRAAGNSDNLELLRDKVAITFAYAPELLWNPQPHMSAFKVGSYNCFLAFVHDILSRTSPRYNCEWSCARISRTCM